jgi:hypothetical protein
VGAVLVEQLRVGDELVSYDLERGRRARSRVRLIEPAHAERLFVIGRLRVTAEHPIFADGRWTPAREVRPGARLLSSDLEATAAEPLSLAAPTTVFAIGVSSPHNYFAGGLLVHNKAVHVPIGGSQPWRGYFFRRAAKRK